MNYINLSKEISYALRHRPWEYELELDKEGYASIDSLLIAINEPNEYDREITIDDIKHIINTSDKKRFEINNDKIRALYGHTVPMHIDKTECLPPDILYHGTTHKYINLIKANGLKPMQRQYVHLSVDINTANIVGSRKDKNPIILKINAKQASRDGIKFYVGNDKVWLVDYIPSKYIIEI